MGHLFQCFLNRIHPDLVKFYCEGEEFVRRNNPHIESPKELGQIVKYFDLCLFSLFKKITNLTVMNASYMNITKGSLLKEACESFLPEMSKFTWKLADSGEFIFNNYHRFKKIYRKKIRKYLKSPGLEVIHLYCHLRRQGYTKETVQAVWRDLHEADEIFPKGKTVLKSFERDVFYKLDQFDSLADLMKTAASHKVKTKHSNKREILNGNLLRNQETMNICKQVKLSISYTIQPAMLML